MGNTGTGGGRRRNGGNHHQQQQQQQRQNHPSPTRPQPSDRPQQTEIQGSRYVFAGATPYPNAYPHPQFQNPNLHPQYFHYNGHYPPPIPSPLPYDGHHRSHEPGTLAEWAAYSGRHHHLNASHVTHVPTPHVEYQKAVTIRNDVNLKKETLHMEPDEENPGRFLVAFTFDATVAGSWLLINAFN